MERTYSVIDVLEKIPSLTRRKITCWIRKNYLGEVKTIWSGDNFQYRFSDADVKLLKKIQNNLDKGWTLRAAAQKAREYFDRGKRNNLPFSCDGRGLKKRSLRMTQELLPEG